MRLIASYDIYIFDCDGVVLDSNQLKIDAMEKALLSIVIDNEKVSQCVNYFRNNFGKSRFHHVDIFVEEILELEGNEKQSIRESILQYYSSQCKALYFSADLTPGFIEFISGLQGKKYIASGSEQQELREVFEARGLALHFDNIFGSPAKKSDLVANILEPNKQHNAIMFGDAISDLEAANNSKIDFIGYLPFSNVKSKLIALSIKFGHQTIEKWSEIL
jgi:phosphoglycolate phosphatase-like HAD superfamily hydrolase